jgi:mannose-6-phosphate isomerase-like protein (cupin superfamily)
MEKFEDRLSQFVYHIPKREVVGNLDFVTDPKLPIQVGIHEPKEDRVTRLHLHKFFIEFFYVERGSMTVTFTDSTFKERVTKVINQGDMFVMLPHIGHTVELPKGCRVIEIHQGPYVDDKLFDETSI